LGPFLTGIYVGNRDLAALWAPASCCPPALLPEAPPEGAGAHALRSGSATPAAIEAARKLRRLKVLDITMFQKPPL
jgi:hypothetical protein